jgi:hypothetical protein
VLAAVIAKSTVFYIASLCDVSEEHIASIFRVEK